MLYPCIWPRSRPLNSAEPSCLVNRSASVSLLCVNWSQLRDTDTHRVAAGIMISYWLCYGTSFIGGQACNADQDAQFGDGSFNPHTDVPAGGCTGQTALAWRLPLCLQCVPAVILLGGSFFLPFSPRWLMFKGREDEARTNIARLHGLPIDDPIVETEWLEIKAAVMFDERTAREQHPNKEGISLSLAKVSMLLTNKGLFRRLALGCILMFFQQFTVSLLQRPSQALSILLTCHPGHQRHYLLRPDHLRQPRLERLDHFSARYRCTWCHRLPLHLPSHLLRRSFRTQKVLDGRGNWHDDQPRRRGRYSRSLWRQLPSCRWQGRRLGGHRLHLGKSWLSPCHTLHALMSCRLSAPTSPTRGVPLPGYSPLSFSPLAIAVKPSVSSSVATI